MIHQKRPLIGEIFIAKGAITAEQIVEALELQKEEGGSIGDILLRLKLLKEGTLLEALSEQWKLPYQTELDINEIDPALTEKIPLSFAKRHQFLPIKRKGKRIVCATAKPLNLRALDDFFILLKSQMDLVIVPSEEIMRCIHQVYELATDSPEDAISDFSGDNLSVLAEEIGEPEDLLDTDDEAPMILLVNSIFFKAVQQRASDIHFEPFEREVKVRYRVDGVLYNVLTSPKRLQSALISRVKIMAGMNIAEKRLPQDGRISLRIGGREIDIRVSDIPTAHGERLVLRILEKSSESLDLTQIGLSDKDLKSMENLTDLAHGIILVTGPTGSGKTTTLYSALSRINSPDKNILTIEDPIEYQLQGIGQIQVNSKIGLTFASGLRSILRQDPDVIMIGEIRDSETATIAIQASLTGHLVFSTLHTNDSAGAVTRLLDMGIEPFLVSSSVVAMIAQRLVRRICQECRKSYQPSAEEYEKMGLPPDSKHSFFKGPGCSECLNTGFKGRSGIYEILLLDDEIRNMILSKADSTQIKAAALSKGMKSLREDGARRVIAGLTTTEEVLRVTQEEKI
ncbi:Type IV fimbrial assembly, ATPase PilB [hydrothermal vent metagenome]|uniref:protein-secreting ATPase n=1 Tax=hydrothermal vent metagenome TaxID=652676 RepID=A0A3B1C725_9ZZZZ